MQTLYFFNYNNYYNRIVKQQKLISDYVALGDTVFLGTVSGINFNPNDGVNTEQVVNIDQIIKNGEAIDLNRTHPDYLITTDEDSNIISRWFIIDSQRTRGSQYKLTLRRDLVVDYYNDTVNAPCFIEKATLGDDNPLIFNSENMTYNQILSDVDTLEDETHCPWIVGYFTKEREDASEKAKPGGDGRINVTASFNSDFIPSNTYTTEAEWKASDLYKLTQKTYKRNRYSYHYIIYDCKSKKPFR